MLLPEGVHHRFAGGVTAALVGQHDEAGDHVIRVKGLFAGMDAHTDPPDTHLRALLDVFEEATLDFTPYRGIRLH